MKLFRYHTDPSVQIPRGWRVAYFDYFSNAVILYPVGVHLVVMLARRLWELSYRCKASRLERLMEAVRRKAVEEDRAGRNYPDWDIRRTFKALEDLGDKSNLP
jgi:hypothetical protein